MSNKKCDNADIMHYIDIVMERQKKESKTDIKLVKAAITQINRDLRALKTPVYGR